VSDPSALPVKMRFMSHCGKMPTKASSGAAGMDLYSAVEALLRPGERKMLRTDISVELPGGSCLYVVGRSGLFLEHGIMVHFGTIDSDYRGNMAVIVVNLGGESYTVRKGERIAQAVLCFHGNMALVPVKEREEMITTERGEAGFGSTGKF